MRTWKVVTSLTLLGLRLGVDALPTEENLARMMAGSGNLDKRCPFATAGEVEDELSKRADLTGSPIDISGEHAFQPPDLENGDQRGPCPGLNALANHGYIPHNGVVSMVDAIAAVNQVYGMGVDLATVLSSTSTVFVGNPISLEPSFSIGGNTPAVSNLLGNVAGLFGEPQGLDGSHGICEADSSNTRDDLYVTGDNSRLNMDKFMEWYSMSSDGTFSMDLMAERAKIRFHQSKQTNPNFYFGPFTGLVARNAAYLVGARLFGNYSTEHPEGHLTKEIVRNFHAIYGEEDNLTYREGWERIPENWYKSPEDWGVLRLQLDIVNLVSKYPELGSIGGNTGTVNSFTGVDLSDLTGGVLNSKTLLEDNNLLCFVFQVLRFASPNSLSGLYKSIEAPLKLITDAIAQPMLDLACPAFEDLTLGGKPFWEAAPEMFPGAKKSGSVL